MASTYTETTGIEQIGTGEQSGSWGSTTNNNFDLIDRSLNGVGTLTLSGTASTLTTNDGVLSDGHFRVLILAGTLTQLHTITISPNDQAKLYFINNGTVGNQTVRIKQGNGSTVDIANGSQSIVYANGLGAVNGAVAEIKPISAAGSVSTDQLANSSVTIAKTDLDVQDKSGDATVTLTATAVSTYVKHTGTGTLTVGDGQYDGQTINITATGTMTVAWSSGSQGISLGSATKIASGIWNNTTGYWFFSETVTS